MQSSPSICRWHAMVNLVSHFILRKCLFLCNPISRSSFRTTIQHEECQVSWIGSYSCTYKIDEFLIHLVRVDRLLDSSFSLFLIAHKNVLQLIHFRSPYTNFSKAYAKTLSLITSAVMPSNVVALDKCNQKWGIFNGLSLSQEKLFFNDSIYHNNIYGKCRNFTKVCRPCFALVCVTKTVRK